MLLSIAFRQLAASADEQVSPSAVSCLKLRCANNIEIWIGRIGRLDFGTISIL